MSIPPFPSRKAKKSRINDINGRPVSYVVEDEHYWSPKDNAARALCVHRLRFGDGHRELRVGYYMIRNKGRGDYWHWAQYAPMMLAEDLVHLFQTAREKGWI